MLIQWNWIVWTVTEEINSFNEYSLLMVCHCITGASADSVKRKREIEYQYFVWAPKRVCWPAHSIRPHVGINEYLANALLYALNIVHGEKHKISINSFTQR